MQINLACPDLFNSIGRHYRTALVRNHRKPAVHGWYGIDASLLPNWASKWVKACCASLMRWCLYGSRCRSD